MAATTTGKGAVQVLDADFPTFVKQHPLVVIDFWAPWCGPCKRVDPIVSELADELAGKVVFGKMNTDENPNTPRKFGVMSIPTLLIFKGGNVVDQLVGAVPKPEIIKRLNKHMA